MGDQPGGLRPTLDGSHPLFGLGYAAPLVRRTLLRVSDDAATEASATVAEETPVALIYT